MEEIEWVETKPLATINPRHNRHKVLRGPCGEARRGRARGNQGVGRQLQDQGGARAAGCDWGYYPVELPASDGRPEGSTCSRCRLYYRPVSGPFKCSMIDTI